MTFLASLSMMATLSAPVRQDIPPDAERQEARAAIEAAYVQIAKARIAFDKSFFDGILAPNFVTRDDELGSPIYKDRNQFMEMLTAQAKVVTYSRFNIKVEAIYKSNGMWFAITCEKVASQKSGFTQMPDRYSTMIFKDGWQKMQDTWILVSQDVVGGEVWIGKPPVGGW